MRTEIDLGGVSHQIGRYALSVDAMDPEIPYNYALTMVRRLPSGDTEELTCRIGPQTMKELILSLTDVYAGRQEESQ